ncbi:hypothetical protein Dsin_016985 [Dipteronia sinensis]|uniref:DUF1985 domain-containing protein n=1 Tax=Dipteronia sinensis TaxID=43782 RepID=A0AAE0AEF6_9ROSI|nr:hypothetical protein Dsin_016985 [Dipteronia sinensis]
MSKMRNLRASLKTPQADWYDTKITYHNLMVNLQVIDEALDRVVENAVAKRDMYQQSSRIEHGQWQQQFDVVKLCLLYMLNCVLIGAEERNSIPKWQLRLVDDLDALNAFPWGLHVFKYDIFGFKKAILSRPLRYNIFRLAYTLLTVGYDALAVGTDSTYTEHTRGSTAGQKDGRSPIQEAVPHYLECRFAEVISVLNTLWEEVHKSDSMDSVPTPQQDIAAAVSHTETTLQDADVAVQYVVVKSQQDIAALDSALYGHAVVVDAASSDNVEHDMIPTVSTVVSDGGSGSLMGVGLDAPQVFIPIVVISDTTHMSHMASGSGGPADPSL